MLISNAFNGPMPCTVATMYRSSESLRNNQLIEDILRHSGKITEYTVKKMNKSSLIELYRLVMAGHHSGDSLSYPYPDNEDFNYVYRDFLKSVHIEKDIEDRELPFIEKLEEFFHKGLGNIGYVNIMIALFLNSTLIEALKNNNYNQTEIDLITPRISVLRAIAGTGICVVVRLEFIDRDGYKQCYIIEPLLNEIYQEEEMHYNFKRLNFPAYASANTAMEIDRVLTGYVNNQQCLAYFSILLSQQSDFNFRNDSAMPFSRKQDKFHWTSVEKIHRESRFSNKNNFANATYQARVTFAPMVQQQVTNLIKDIMDIASECRRFTHSIIQYSSSRAFVEIAKKESFYLSESAIKKIQKNIKKDSSLLKNNNIITKNENFLKIEDNTGIDYLIPYTINQMYNTLNTRCGNCLEFAMLTAILLTLSLRGSLLARGYDSNIITSLHLSVQVVGQPIEVGSAGDHCAAQLDFVINNRKRSFIIDSFINKAFETKNISRVYGKYGYSYYIPENIAFYLDKTIEKLLRNEFFLDAMKRMLSDMFGIVFNDLSATGPLKEVKAFSEVEFKKMCDTYQPCEVTQKYGIPAYSAREVNTLIPIWLSKPSSALYRLLRDIASLPAALYRHAVEVMR